MNHLTDRTRRIVRIPAHGKVAGVCAGIADYLGVDVVLVRAAYLILTMVPGAIVGGVLAYVVAWVLLPAGDASEPRPVERRLYRSERDRQVAGVCGGIAEYFSLDPTLVRVLWAVLSVFLGMVFLGLAAYVAAWFVMPTRPAAELTPATAP